MVQLQHWDYNGTGGVIEGIRSFDYEEEEEEEEEGESGGRLRALRRWASGLVA